MCCNTSISEIHSLKTWISTSPEWLMNPPERNLRYLPFRANSCPEISPIKRLLLDAKHICWSQGSMWFSADTQWFPDNPWDIIILSVRTECPPSYWKQDLARAEGSRMTEQVACHKWRMLQRKARWMAIRCIKCIKIPRPRQKMKSMNVQHSYPDIFREKVGILKRSYDVAKKNRILCIWCNAVCLRSSRSKRHIIFHILYTIVAPLCLFFWNTLIFTKLIVVRSQACSDWPAIPCVVTAWIPQACDGNVMPLPMLWCREPAFLQSMFPARRD